MTGLCFRGAMVEMMGLDVSHDLGGRRLELARLDVLKGDVELQLLGLAAVDGGGDDDVVRRLAVDAPQTVTGADDAAGSEFTHRLPPVKMTGRAQDLSCPPPMPTGYLMEWGVSGRPHRLLPRPWADLGPGTAADLCLRHSIRWVWEDGKP